MLKSKELQYNIASQGSLRTFLYGYPNELFKLLSEYDYDEKLHNMKQLGALQNYLRGAHHTRYEYVFLQWTLIHEMCQRNKSSGLGSNLNQNFNKFKIGNKNPTKAEILQMLSILTNIGHLPATFTSSSVLLTLLNNNEDNIRTAFRSGLYQDKYILDELLKNDDIYKIHLANSMFNVHRIDKRNENAKKLKELSLWILRNYILREESENIELWETYDLIRKISYLILDSNYAPIPFKLDFSSILMLLDDKDSVLSNKRSNFQKTLDKMDDVLEETLYLEPNTLLYTGVHKELLLEKYNKVSNKVLKEQSKSRFNIKDVKQILFAHSTTDELNSIFEHSNDLIEIDWEEDRLLDITFKEDIISLMKFNNSNEFEMFLKNKLGPNTIRIAVNLSPSKNTTKIIVSIRKNHKNKVKKSLEIVKELIDLKENLKKKGIIYSIKDNEQFIQNLLDFHFMYLFEGKKIKYNVLNRIETPYIYENGTKKIIDKLGEFINEIKEEVHKDILYEFEVLKTYFEKNMFIGLQILYFGGITVLNTKTNKYVLEIDGLILRPNKSNEDFAHILEAKNITRGESIAQTQLENNLGKGLNTEEINYTVELLSERNAIAKLNVIRD